jgi:primosomal protein N' (replication factor Y)
MFFIEVILPLQLPKTFTYQVNEAEFAVIKIGVRVAVPFGKSKIYTSLVIDKHQNAPQLYDAKEIYQIIDEHPVVNKIQIKHWFWISEYYMCTIGDVFRSAMPSIMLLESETSVVKNALVADENIDIDDNEFLILDALNYQSAITVATISSIVERKNVFPILQKMMAKNLIHLQEELVDHYKPKLVKYAVLNTIYEAADGLQELLNTIKSEKQKQIILAYFQLKANNKNGIKVTDLLVNSNTTTAVLNGLIKKEVFSFESLQEDRVDFTANLKLKEIVLSTAQEIAFSEINTSFETKNVSLLHGITASGKTEIYIKLMEEVLKQNKQVLFLLPEIALTTQLVARLTKYFGNQIAVFHSKYSNKERLEVWNQVLSSSEKAKIVIGARSALFLPFSNLGLVLVDEEHEQTFKQQDPAPRYHARDAAIVLANFHDAKVLLGSATPSIETYYNAISGKFGLINLIQRYGNATLPEAVLVDLKEAYFRKKMNGHFSHTLLETISESLENKEQIILFQNRRGYSPVLECITCGHVPQCTQCDVSLTYHKFKNQLRCHYCGYAIAKPINCHACSSLEITTKGFGTEQIELELASIFPNANIKRMDQDTTRGKYSFEKLITSFKNREIDILVGTQMLAKGLDFDNVSLVGILNADTMLHYPDFRAFERSFQMMTQVAGRAGRADKIGKVVIQTYNPMHAIIQQVTNNDYLQMYKEQLYDRKIYYYPPYFKLIKLQMKNRDYEKLKNASVWLQQVLSQNLQMQILGPEEPSINRVRNEYLRNIVIKVPKETNLTSTKKTIKKILNSFDSIPQFKSVKVIPISDFY